MRAIHIVLMASIIVTTGVGCDSDPEPSGPGESCKVPGDCWDGLICVRGVCREPLRSIGDVCESDEQCLENNCPKGVCCPPYCRVDCNGYECTGANGTACLNADICQSGYCVDGRCCESACEESCMTCDGEVPGACESDTAPECITGSVAVRVIGVSRDISVVISGSQQYDLTTSGGEVVQAGVPGGTYSVECEDLNHYTVAVETQDDTIDSDGELISFSCVYTTTAPPDTGFIEVHVVGQSRDVFVYIRGPDDTTATFRSSEGMVIVDDVRLGTYQVTCEDVNGYQTTVETNDDTVDFTGEIITFTCRYELNPHWMVVGDEGQILWSEDAVNWVEHVPPLGDHDLLHAALGNGVLVIIGDEVIFKSTNMEIWSSIPPPDSLSHYTNVRFIDGKFLMTDSRGHVWLSTDGSDWDETGPGDNNLIAADIAYGNGRYVLVGREYSLHKSVIYYSDDLVTWINTSPNGNSMNAVTWGMGNFMVVGEGGQGWWSPDGGETPWQEINSEWGRGNFLDIAYGGNRFIAVGNGMQWTYAASPTEWQNVYTCRRSKGIGYGPGTFIALTGYTCGCFSFDNGRTWDEDCFTGEKYLNDLIYLP